MNRPGRVLLVAVLGSTMAFLEGTAVNVALPALQAALGATSAQVQWVVEAYSLFLAALVLVGGALGDRLGRKRVFLAGTVLFAVASSVCGAASGPALLIGARAVQGVGGALLVPGSLALITTAFPRDEERGVAIGRWSSASAVTASVGPVLGGWLATHASWRWVFFLNVPAALAVLALSKGIPESRDDEQAGPLDIAGAALAVFGLGGVVYALLDPASADGLARPRVLAPLVGGLAALGAFVFVESRAAAPMMPLGLFRSRDFSVANALTLLLYGAFGGALFFLPFELVQVRRFSSAAAGAALLPLALLIAALSPWAGRLCARRGPRIPLGAGPIVCAAGFALLAAEAPGWGPLLAALVLLGVGMGLVVAPLTTVVMGAVEGRHAGIASGVNNSVSRAAGLLAIAGLGVALAARFHRELDARLAHVPLSADAAVVVASQRARLAGADLSALDPPSRGVVGAAFDGAFAAGFRETMLVCAGLAVLAGLSSLGLRGGSQTRAKLELAVPKERRSR